MNICRLWKTFQNTLNELNRVSILDLDLAYNFVGKHSSAINSLKCINKYEFALIRKQFYKYIYSLYCLTNNENLPLIDNSKYCITKA